jgi:hypothetical protein
MRSPSLLSFSSAPSIFTFLPAVKVANPQAAAGIDALASDQSIAGADMDAAGSTETNGAGSPDTLPVYAVIVPGGGAAQVCSTDQFGTYNKLSNSRFLRIALGTADRYQVTVSGPPGSDPDMLLYRAGVVLAFADSAADGAESFPGGLNLAAGEHVLEVYEYTNAFPDPLGAARGRTCFDVRIDAL